MKMAGWNSSTRVKGKLQAALYYARKRRQELAQQPEPEPPVQSMYSDDYFAQEYTE